MLAIRSLVIDTQMERLLFQLKKKKGQRKKEKKIVKRRKEQKLIGEKKKQKFFSRLLIFN